MFRCILFLLLFIHSSIFSQPTFVHRVGNLGADFGYSCSPAIGGGSVIAVLKGLDSLARIVFVDTAGNMTSYKNFRVDNFCTPLTILQTNDGYVVLLQISDSSYSYNNSLALYFTNLSGDYRRDKQYSFSKNEIPLNLVHRKAGGFICFSEGVSSTGGAFTVVTAVNDTGEIIWSNQYTAPYGLPGVKGVEMPDSNICFVAKLPDPYYPSSREDIAVIMLDRTGTILWSRVYRTTYGDLPYAIATNDSCEIFITGRSGFVGHGADCFILRLDRNGNLLHSGIFGGGAFNIVETPRCIIAANDGSAVVLGEMVTEGPWGPITPLDIFLLNIDSSASLLSAYSYTFSTTYNYAWDMYRTDDGGIFFTGSMQPPSASSHTLIVKTEADGNLNCYSGNPQFTEYNDIYQDTNTIITKSQTNVIIRNYAVSAPVSPINDYVICGFSTEVNFPLSSAGFIYTLYPNPTDGLITLELDESLRIDQIRIYQADGSLIHSEKIFIQAEKHVLNFESFKTGLYILECISERGIDRRLVAKN